MQKQFTYQDKKIFYRVIGSGRPVIFIHGFGEDGNIWNSLIEVLEKKIKLIVPDLPGAGKSALIPDMSMEGMAAVIHSIIHEEKIEHCTVIGHSMGGYITLALMESYWNHVSSFALFHSSAFADSEEKKLNRIKGIEFVQKNGAAEFLKTVIPNLFYSKNINENPDLLKDIMSGIYNFSDTAIVSYYNAMMKRPDRTEILKNTSVPVLFILGKYDNAVPMEDGLKQCHLPEKSYIHILRKSGHMGMLEETQKCIEIVEDFLSES